MKNINKIKSEIENKLRNLERSIVATPSESYLESFTKANGGSSDFLLVQLAKNYGYKLALEEINRLIEITDTPEPKNVWILKSIVYGYPKYYEYNDPEELLDHVRDLSGEEDGYGYIYTNVKDNQIKNRLLGYDTIKDYCVVRDEEIFNLLEIHL